MAKRAYVVLLCSATESCSFYFTCCTIVIACIVQERHRWISFKSQNGVVGSFPLHRETADVTWTFIPLDNAEFHPNLQKVWKTLHISCWMLIQAPRSHRSWFKETRSQCSFCYPSAATTRSKSTKLFAAFSCAWTTLNLKRNNFYLLDLEKWDIWVYAFALRNEKILLPRRAFYPSGFTLLRSCCLSTQRFEIKTPDKK